jgi:tetratricopeptide (TPR) repeat protein
MKILDRTSTPQTLSVPRAEYVLAPLAPFARLLAALGSTVLAARASRAAGNLALAAGMHQSAAACFAECVRLAPADVQGWLGLARVQVESGDMDKCAESLAKAEPLVTAEVAVRVAYFTARGRLYEAQAKWSDAAHAYRQVLQADSTRLAVWRQLGACLQNSNEIGEAQRCYIRALPLREGFDLPLRDLALLQLLQSRPGEALPWLDHLLRMSPGDVYAHLMVADALRSLSRAHEALSVIDSLPEAQANMPKVLNMRGAILLASQRPEEALGAWEKAYALEPHNDYLVNSAAALTELQRTDEAIERLDRVLADDAERPDALDYRAIALMQRGQYHEAVEMYDRCIAAARTFTEEDFLRYKFHRSIALLTVGDFDRGWTDYDARWGKTERGSVFSKPKFRAADWAGEPLEGKAIVLYHEQGLGDSIQFVRFVHTISAMAGRVYVSVPVALLPVLGKLPDNCELLADGARVPPLDFMVSLMGLGRLLRVNESVLPGPMPYLVAPDDLLAKWRERLGESRKLRVALVWAGNPAHGNDYNRSISLRKLLEHAPTEIDFVSVQKVLRDGDRELLAGYPHVRHVGDELETFGDTAAVLELVDAIVTVDTSVAHLAGGLGRPLSLIIPSSPDWRWLADRDDSPWYPSAKIYRQKSLGEWDDPVSRAMQDLLKLSGKLMDSSPVSEASECEAPT